MGKFLPFFFDYVFLKFYVFILLMYWLLRLVCNYFYDNVLWVCKKHYICNQNKTRQGVFLLFVFTNVINNFQSSQLCQ